MSPATAPDLTRWLTHTQAAARLSTDERTVRRWIKAGRLEAARRSQPGKKPALVVDPATVERVRLERRGPVLLDRASPEMPSRDLVAIQTGPFDLTVLAEVFRAVMPPPVEPPAAPKPWLTIAEATKYSGLSRSYLLRQARAGVPWVVDEWEGGAKSRWKVNREALGKVPL